MHTLLAMILVACFAAVVTAIHLHLTSRPRTPLALGASIDDIDAEFFRIIEREGLRDLIG